MLSNPLLMPSNPPNPLSPLLPLPDVITGHPANNVTDAIYSKLGVNLHQQAAHPIGIIKTAIYEFFDRQHPATFHKFDDLQPLVSAQAVSWRAKDGFSRGGALQGVASMRLGRGNAPGVCFLPLQPRGGGNAQAHGGSLGSCWWWCFLASNGFPPARLAPPHTRSIRHAPAPPPFPAAEL